MFVCSSRCSGYFSVLAVRAKPSPWPRSFSPHWPGGPRQWLEAPDRMIGVFARRWIAMRGVTRARRAEGRAATNEFGIAWDTNVRISRAFGMPATRHICVHCSLPGFIICLWPHIHRQQSRFVAFLEVQEIPPPGLEPGSLG